MFGVVSKLKARLIFFGISVVLVSLILSGIVYAPWTTLGTGYAITSNYHGVDVPLGTPVTVTAGTLDPSVTHVKFIWREPATAGGAIRWEDIVPIFTNTTMGQWNNGTTANIRYAESTRIPDVLGDWGVQALFQDSAETDVLSSDVIKFRATSFNNIIPEIPVGTIGAAAAMIAALALFVIKKKRVPQTAKK
jgi:hypothetical protein